MIRERKTELEFECSIEEIKAQLTGRLLHEIYPKLISRDAAALAATFYEDAGDPTGTSDGYFLFEQPAGGRNEIEPAF